MACAALVHCSRSCAQSMKCWVGASPDSGCCRGGLHVLGDTSLLEAVSVKGVPTAARSIGATSSCSVLKAGQPL